MLCLSLCQRDLNTEITSALPSTMTFTIGRAGDVRTELLGNYVSRIHARVSPRDRFWLVEDLQSRNGIYDEHRQRVQSIALTKAGDCCWIAAPRNGLGSIWIKVVEGNSCQYNRATLRVDLHAWRKKAEAAIDELAHLVFTNSDDGGKK